MSEAQPTEEEIKNMSPEQIAELQKKNCVFCKIIAGEVPSHKVYEDDKFMAILDIYPSSKGHTLIFPKEHVPIMPLMPPETFKHIFRKIKYITKGIKDGVPATKSTIFIANGAVAGQQSPHFLFHVIPRDNGDGLDNFITPEKGKDQKDVLKILKTNLTKMMQNHLQREGKILVPTPSKDQLANVLEQNPELKKMIMDKPDEVKKGIESNPQLKVLFNGINIDKLSQSLKGEVKDVPEPVKEVEKEEPQPLMEEDVKEPEEVSDTPAEPEKKEIEEEVSEPQGEPETAPELSEKEQKEKKQKELDNIANLFK